MGAPSPRELKGFIVEGSWGLGGDSGDPIGGCSSLGGGTFVESATERQARPTQRATRFEPVGLGLDWVVERGRVRKTRPGHIGALVTVGPPMAQSDVSRLKKLAGTCRASVEAGDLQLAS